MTLTNKFWCLLTFLLCGLFSAMAGAYDARAIDQQAVSTDMVNFVSGNVPTGSPYWIGRNAEWGGMYSPRWQLGAGRAARVNTSANQLSTARRAWLAVKAGADAIQSNGAVPFTLPSSYNYTPTEADIAQAGAFYLGEACTTYRTVSLYPWYVVAQVATSTESSAVYSDLSNGLTWLKTKKDILLQADASAPNRLLFDALAFYSCSRLSGATADYQSFVAQALALYADGVFMEGGGADTHYQAVAINQVVDLLLMGYPNPSLETAVLNAALWYLPRIDAAGVIHSAGNTRTCWAGEEFIGNPKKMSPIEVHRALTYVGKMAGRADLLDAAGRVARWINSGPTETCIQ
jgi:hypothetical protein